MLLAGKSGPRRRLSDLHWKVVELWDDLHYPNRRRTLRTHACNFGLHWPISFWANRGGEWEPPVDNWACEMCGKDHLPWRAWAWRVPGLNRVVR